MQNKTIKDIASKVGVSTATVSRYLNKNGYVSEKARKKIDTAIKELDFVPNHVAISLKTMETRIIGIVIPELFNISFMDTVQAINDIAMEAGYQTIILSSEEKPEKEQKILEVLIARRVDGILIATAGSNGDRVLRINDRKLPIVLIDRDVCNTESKVLLDSVINDNYSGAYQMVRHLISLGHRRIAILAANRDQPHLNARLSGYTEALKDCGIPVNPNHIEKADLSFEAGYNSVMRLMSMQSERPTAIFALNNLTSLGAISALHDLRIEVPAELSLCGFGEFKYHKILNPDLTVVNQHSYQLGKIAAEILVKKIQSKEPWIPSRILLPADILFRSSCAAPPQDTPIPAV